MACVCATPSVDAGGLGGAGGVVVGTGGTTTGGAGGTASGGACAGTACGVYDAGREVGPGTGGVLGHGGAPGAGGMGGRKLDGATDSDGAGGFGGAIDADERKFDSTKPPCDIYADDGGPCVAAHSTVRVLLSAYSGPLYQVRRTSDNATKDIGALARGGFANAADQDAFCGTDACTISIIYDQSGKGNDLTKAPAGGQVKPTEDKEANANALPITISGHNVYGEHNPPGVGYRNNNAVGLAKGDDPETIYMITSGDYSNGGCCFDYGNAETNSHDNGEGAVEAVYFGTCTIWGKGDGDGPWVMGDLDNGLWAGDVSPFNRNTPVRYKYITGMVKGDKAGSNHWVIKVGNAESGLLDTPFDGRRPNSRYNPMRKEGGIILGAAGDNSNAGQGNFLEGIMTAHFSSDAADDAVQANIVAAYGK